MREVRRLLALCKRTQNNNALDGNPAQCVLSPAPAPPRPGVWPVGSTWARNPVPRINDDNIGLVHPDTCPGPNGYVRALLRARLFCALLRVTHSPPLERAGSSSAWLFWSYIIIL